MGSGGLEVSLQQKQSISEVWRNLYNKNTMHLKTAFYKYWKAQTNKKRKIWRGSGDLEVWHPRLQSRKYLQTSKSHLGRFWTYGGRPRWDLEVWRYLYNKNKAFQRSGRIFTTKTKHLKTSFVQTAKTLGKHLKTNEKKNKFKNHLEVTWGHEDLATEHRKHSISPSQLTTS